MNHETKRPMATQSAILSRTTARWFGLPLIALVAALWYAPSTAGTFELGPQRSEFSPVRDKLFEHGTAVLAASSIVQALGRTAEQHDHRNQNDHSGYGCNGIDCSGVADIALRGISPPLPTPPLSIKPGTPVNHLARPPLRPPRNAV